MDQYFWLNQPKQFTYSNDTLEIVTESNTDYWQKTHYGFQFDNAPTFLKNVEGDFTFQATVQFNYKELYDQAGIMLYENSENWIKVSMEYHNPEFSTLGSVVTNLGYSDWAFQNTSSNTNKVHYRLSRVGSDFLIEFSLDGQNFQKMRIAHMHKKIDIAKVGVYACSPKDSSFKALFSHLTYGKCEWTQ